MSRPLAPTLMVLFVLAAGCGPASGSPDLELEGPPPDLYASLPQGLVTCDERQDQGYTSGNPFDITVVTCDAKPCERDTANAYAVMQQAAAAAGVTLVVVSGFRTMAEQQYLYGCYVQCNCNNCNLAAKPGYSNHQSGHALDLNTSSPGVLAWLNTHGATFGFSRTVPSEDWHWEWWGGGPGGGPCGLTPAGCTTGEDANCARYGCGCRDHACTGGFCPGSGCSAQQASACADTGCACVDGACSGGLCAGTGCTTRESSDCAAQGCGCVDHACSGGACGGDGCTTRQRGSCAESGLTCDRGACGEPLPQPADGGTPAPPPDADGAPTPVALEAAVGSFGCAGAANSTPLPALALLLAGLHLARRR